MRTKLPGRGTRNESIAKTLELKGVVKTRASYRIAIGTPNLGTRWVIDFLNFFAETFFSENTAKVAGEIQNFPLTVRLLINGVTIYSETIFNEIKEEGRKKQEVNLNLQFPQTPIAYGGQQVELEVEIARETNVAVFITLVEGKSSYTLGYTIESEG